MAHYRSTLLLLTCVTCLANALTPVRAALSDRDLGSVSSEATQPIKANVAIALLPIQPNQSNNFTFHSPIVAQASSPADSQPPSSKKKKASATTKKSPSNSSDSKLPGPINAVLRSFTRYRGLWLVGGAAFLVTGGAVSILLRLFSDDDREPIARPDTRSAQFTNMNFHSDAGIALEAHESSPSSDNPFHAAIASTLPEAGNREVYTVRSSVFDPGAEDSQETSPSEVGHHPNARYPEHYTNGHDDELLRVSAATNPGESRVKVNIIDELIQDLYDPLPAKRHQAIWELGQKADSRAIEPLVNLLVNSDSQQQSLILGTLSKIGVRILKPLHRAWLISLQDDKAEVRKNAIRDLTPLYELLVQMSPLLQRATDDPDAEVQETARWALAQLKGFGRGEDRERGVK